MTTPSAAVLRARLRGKGRVRHLQLLVQVAELGSIHKAAAAVGMSQPGATQQIAELERLLETSLFLRHAKGAGLTNAGKQLLPLAKRLLQIVDEVADEAAALTSESEGVVRVVASQSGMSALVAQAVPEFHTVASNVAVHVRESEPAAMATVVGLREADLAVLRLPKVIPEGWRFEPLLHDRLIVVAGPQHPLVRRAAAVTVDELRGEQWLALPVDSIAREAFDRLFKDSTPPAISRVTARAPALIWAMLTRFDLLAITPATLLAQFLRSGVLAEIPLEASLPLPPVGLLLPVNSLGSAAERFAEFMRLRALGTARV